MDHGDTLILQIISVCYRSDSEVSSMSGFSFDPSGPPRTTPFKRLASAQVGGSGVASSGEASPAPPAREIFNEFSISDPHGVAQRDPPERVALRALESAVDSLSESSKTLEYITSSTVEVEQANSAAADVSVKDVDAAAQLADELYGRIRENERLAREAHDAKLSQESVHRFLS
jgi:hypothetical protein